MIFDRKLCVELLEDVIALHISYELEVIDNIRNQIRNQRIHFSKTLVEKLSKNRFYFITEAEK